MSRKLPLDTLQELARNRKEEAARRLGVLQTAQVSADQKLDLLLQYRQDYAQQLQALMADGLPASQWRNFNNFLSTLDGAIEQQRAIVKQAAVRLDRGRGDWQHHARRLNSFDTLAERLRRQETLAQAKREQRDSDERAARRFIDRAAQPNF
ncbi:flagellar export protein FliJ [Variovorax sp. JS1663]|uniref:flagellar export protein FliJ n=1 Tax=Variovorax sp. JS1663 TaxID=1851577 RepID=UPI000B346C5C|nr:flagellar export protein FliJ [Variovorax sp. JS1663]OUL99240.1 flagellar export protein FliJ [Variovorax sp. JS1663]